MSVATTNVNTAERDEQGVIVRFEKPSRQTIGDTSKITGLVKAKYIIPLIDHLDLQANPRDSKTGNVTDAIQDSIESDPSLFPFKTKGILLAASDYEDLERDRVHMFFDNRSIEGILDGGHNTLAIGMLILKRALALQGKKLGRKRVTWSEFKELWNDNRDAIQRYQISVRKSADGSDEDSGEPDLSFYVPVELLVPANPDDKLCAEEFRHNLLEICEARNNNAELTASAKANQQGLFDELKKQLRKRDPNLYERIEWKTNEGGDIRVQDLISLVWIVLRHAPVVTDEDGKKVEPPAPVKMYSSKADGLQRFERYMSSPDVSSATGDYTMDLRNPATLQALKLAVEIPALYDYIYEQFPSLYNRAGGAYGKITAVEKANSTNTIKTTPFGGKKVDKENPEGFIVPLVYGLNALVDPETLTWRRNPQRFLEQYLPAIVKRYIEVFKPLGWDPQKVGKAAMSYSTVEDAYKMALAGILS
ncbi:AIPR family protein [Bifidobacterium oedipodis]|uniref:AIPR protein n=1 Tax=Bifidobacterium oedipodis TaxID=2675322 RepID=A0A7Y0HS40_9BIFI|nr:AIPR family protein [Bifidobacterium sp. DSM 109957]NMM94755.1 hypothetical protein [Bifidobacterium sp. DSM 109957]